MSYSIPLATLLKSAVHSFSDHCRDMTETEPSRSIVTLDVAKSNRSTCKATGEKIEKGEHRVGVEAYSGGHISMTWQVEEFSLACPDTYCKVYWLMCGTIVSKRQRLHCLRVFHVGAWACACREGFNR